MGKILKENLRSNTENQDKNSKENSCFFMIKKITKHIYTFETIVLPNDR